MGGLDIQPPLAPGASRPAKRGLFSKLFKKDEVMTPRDEIETFDIDEIRRKVGLETPPAPEQPPSSPPTLEEEIVLPDLPKTEMLDDESPAEMPAPGGAWNVAEEPEAPPALPADTWPTSAPAFEKPEASASPISWADDSTEQQRGPSTWSQEQPVPTYEQLLTPGTAEPPHEVTVAPPPSPAVDDIAAIHEEIAHTEIVAPVITPDENVSAAREEPPAHHKTIEKQFADIEKEHRQIDREREKIAKKTQEVPPEWALQKQEVAPEQYFILKNGQKLKNLHDLIAAIAFIDDETFAHHVSDQKNDFALWLKHVLDEEQLANEIWKKKEREEILRSLHQHSTKKLKEYEKETKGLKQQVVDRTEAAKRAAELQRKLDAITRTLAERSMELLATRSSLKAKLKGQMDAEVEKRLANGRIQIAKKQESHELRLRRVREQELAVENRLTAVALREKTLQKAATKFHLDQHELEIERAEFARRKREAELILKESAAIKDLREEAERFRKEALRALEKEREAAANAQSLVREVAQQKQNLLRDQRGVHDELEQAVAILEQVRRREQALERKEAAIVKRAGMLEESRRGRQERSVATKKSKELDEEPMVAVPKPPAAENVTNVHLYRLVDECKAATATGDLEKARMLYNQLRTEFARAKLASHEKSALYNTIRELYDDIHLAMLQ